MQKIKLILFLLLLCNISYSAEIFKWARAEFETKRPAETSQTDLMEEWDYGEEGDVLLLEELEKTTSIKTDKKVYKVSFKDLKQVVEYPIIFMHSAGLPVLSDEELKNMKEYMKRGGLIYAEDCQVGPQNDYFFQAVKTLVEKKIFPDKKMTGLPENHPVFSSHFEFPFGFPMVAGVNHPFTALLDEKGRLIMFLSSRDFHCGWYHKERDPLLRKQALKAGINLIMYSLTN